MSRCIALCLDATDCCWLLQGAFAVAREFWEGLIKIVELAMSAIAMIGSALATISAAGKTQIITVQKHPPH